MLDQIDTDSTTDDNLAEYRVRDSARRLFERLNPSVRDPQIPSDAPQLAIYDWEIAGDTKLDLAAVRSALRSHDGSSLVLAKVNDEHSIVALAVG